MLLEERMRRPRHLGPLDAPDVVGEVGNPACGDVVRVELRLADGRVAEARFVSTGSAYQVAAADVLCECVTGASLVEARAVSAAEVLARLDGMPDRHRHLAHLAVDALRRALRSKQRESEPDRCAMTLEEARAFIERLLAQGPATTQDVEAAAARDGCVLPASAARLLASLRADGRLEAELDVRRQAWVWRPTAPARDAP